MPEAIHDQEYWNRLRSNEYYWGEKKLEKDNEILDIKYQLIKQFWKISRWDGLMILASNTDWYGEYHNSDRILFEETAFNIETQLYKTGKAYWNIRTITNATSNDLKDCIRDEKIWSIIVIWHSSIWSWCASDKVVSATDIWYWSTHLKSWYFISLWCAAQHSIFSVPLWYYLMSDQNNVLWSPPHTLTKWYELKDLSKLVRQSTNRKMCKVNFAKIDKKTRKALITTIWSCK